MLAVDGVGRRRLLVGPARLLVLGVGIGLTMSPSTTAITESLPHEKQGVASALNDTVRELGGAVGIALLGSLVNAGYRSSVSSATSGRWRPTSPPRSRTASARRSPPRRGSVSRRRPVLAAAREALVDGWRLSMWFGVGPGRGRPRLRGRAAAHAARRSSSRCRDLELEPV